MHHKRLFISQHKMLQIRMCNTVSCQYHICMLRMRNTRYIKSAINLFINSQCFIKMFKLDSILLWFAPFNSSRNGDSIYIYVGCRDLKQRQDGKCGTFYAVAGPFVPLWFTQEYIYVQTLLQRRLQHISTYIIFMSKL